MEEQIITAGAGDVRAFIAATVLQPPAVKDTLGAIRLAPHQIDAVARIRRAFGEFGGAFLCDVVGSGKTFIGLAVAAQARRPIIVAPASLREMWKDAMREVRISARYVSVESLSRCTPDVEGTELIVVDEAHHFRNASTLRHRSLARLIEHRPILLMTATPIHNSRRDLESLVSLFLGNRASRLSDPELGRLIVRRNRGRVVPSAAIPEVRTTEWMEIGDDAELASELIALPPPLPPRGAGEAAALASFGLLRQWSSSEAALRAAVKRRIARGDALESSLLAGEYPSERELRTWILGEDCVQLGFPGLIGHSTVFDSVAMLAAISVHRAALRSVAGRLTGPTTLDARRAEHLRAIAAAHGDGDGQVVAFTSYEATAISLFKATAQDVRAAALTSRGGLVAGGRLTRSEVIFQFTPGGRKPACSDRIRLLITTDLLSEGVNLQNADVVVHLDLPWTRARIDQRIGRLARVGSLHKEVRVYGFLPPASADKILRMSALIDRKAHEADDALGRDHPPKWQSPPPPADMPPPEAEEAVHEILEAWLRHGELRLPDDEIAVAAVAASQSGFICVIERLGQITMLSSIGASVSDFPADVARACQAANGGDAAVEQRTADETLKRIDAWVISLESGRIAGLGSSAFLSTRKTILARLDSIAARFPPHRRPLRAQLIERARSVVTAPTGAAAEEEFSLLAKNAAELGDDAWLHRVAQIGAKQSKTNPRGGYNVRALLLLVGPTPPPSS